MNLKNRIDLDIKEAMKSRNQDELRALRAIKSMILIAETEKGSGGELDEDAEVKLLMKAVKQRKDSAEVYQSQNRDDLLEKEEKEIEVIKKYLPKQLSENELKEKINQIVERTGASGMADMGKVMGVATKELAGQADGKVISEIVKNLLSQL